jgi:hypothetical protein
MQDEPEIMSKIAKLLEPLDTAGRSRVLGWIVSAMNIRALPRMGGGSQASATNEPGSVGDSQFPTFAELFHAAAPSSEKEKALVAACWVQRSSGVDQFSAQQINTELKHIGHRVANITDALSQLIGERPNLVIQLIKSGSSKQARKTYKVTDAGVRRVSEMLNDETGERR